MHLVLLHSSVSRVSVKNTACFQGSFQSALADFVAIVASALNDEFLHNVSILARSQAFELSFFQIAHSSVDLLEPAHRLSCLSPVHVALLDFSMVLLSDFPLSQLIVMTPTVVLLFACAMFAATVLAVLPTGDTPCECAFGLCDLTNACAGVWFLSFLFQSTSMRL